MEKQVLITDEVHTILIEGLQQQGYIVNYEPKITAAEVLQQIDNYVGLIINSKVYVGKEMLDKATKLKFVCRVGSGLEVIDIEYAKQRDVAAFNSPEGNRVAVGEFALGGLLGLMRNMCRANTEVKNSKWNRESNRGYELTGKTVGLIAYGNNAQAFAKLLAGFDVRVLAYDKYYHGFDEGYVTETPLNTIYKEADVLSLHLPLTTETTYMIDYAFLSSFKKPYWLINTSRGKVMRTNDMLKCIEEGKIRGAVLDVLENEKINELSAAEADTFKKLCAEERILLSPHIAGWTHESKRRIAEVLLQKIAAIN